MGPNLIYLSIHIHKYPKVQHTGEPKLKDVNFQVQALIVINTQQELKLRQESQKSALRAGRNCGMDISAAKLWNPE